MKKRVGVILILIIILLLAYVLKDIDFKKVFNAVQNINLFYFGIAFLFCFISFLLWNMRQYLLLKDFVKADYSFLLTVLFAGVFMNTITPGTGIGGEPVRAYFLNKKYKKPKSKFLGFIMVEKVINYLVFGGFLIFSFLFLILFLNMDSKIKLTLEIILLLAVLFTIGTLILGMKRKKLKAQNYLEKLYNLNVIKKNFENKREFVRYINKRLANFSESFFSAFNGKKKFLILILISLLMWLSNYFVSYALFFSFNYKISFLAVVIAVTLSYLIGDLSIIPGGIGLMESTMFLTYSAMGVSPEIAAVISLLSRIIYYFYSLLIGGLSLIYLKIKK